MMPDLYHMKQQDAAEALTTMINIILEITNPNRFTQIEMTQEDSSFTAENSDEMIGPTAAFLQERAAQKWASI